MNQLIVRIAAAAIGVSIAGTGAVIYSMDSSNDGTDPVGSIFVESTVEANVDHPTAGDSSSAIVELEANDAAVVDVSLNVGTGLRLDQEKSVGDVLVRSVPKANGSVATSEFVDNSAFVERIGVEINAFLKTRQEARDENPLPELIVWLESRSEIEDVAVTENAGEIYIIFKGGGATVLQIGQ
ncbi:MAG: hypothetical protein Q7S02_00585 [bacterium]|nr:hypothetical protein [bacterium]